MQKIKNKAFFSQGLLIIAFLFALFPRAADAFQGAAAFHNIINKNEKIHSDVYLVGWSVDVEGEVDGNLFALGGVVHVHGPVHGNIYLAGGQVEVDSPVSGDVNILAVSAESRFDCRACRILALDGEQQGKIRGDLLALAVLAGSSGNVGGDTLIGGGSVTIGGNHAGRLLDISKKVNITGVIHGDSDIKADSITLGPSARFIGHVDYTSPNLISASMEQFKGGSEHFYPPPRVVSFLHFPWLYRIMHRVLSAIWLTVVGLFALTTWLKRPSRSILDAMLAYPWECFGIGLLVCVIVPGLGILLIVSLLGLPLGFILLGLFAIGVYVTRLFASLYIGERFLQLLEHHRPPYWQSLPLGVIIFTVLTSIPYFGIAVSLVTIPLAFGAKFVAGRLAYETSAALS